MTDLQIGASKMKIVRNYLFRLKSIISDVASSVRKSASDLHIMDFKQMFGSKEACITKNYVFKAGVKDDILPFIREA